MDAKERSVPEDGEALDKGSFARQAAQRWSRQDIRLERAKAD